MAIPHSVIGFKKVGRLKNAEVAYHDVGVRLGGNEFGMAFL
jgi:hypothetical protein